MPAAPTIDDLQLASRLVRARRDAAAEPLDEQLWLGIRRSLEREPDQSIYRLARHRGKSFLDAAAVIERMRDAGVVEVVRQRRSDDRVRLLDREGGLAGGLAEVEAMTAAAPVGPPLDDPLWGRVIGSLRELSEQPLSSLAKRVDSPVLELAAVLRVLRDAGMLVFTDSQHSERARLSPEGRQLAPRFRGAPAGPTL